MSTLKKLLKDDNDYIRYRRIIKLSEDLDIQSWLDEAGRLHAQKYSRLLLNKTSASSKSLTKASAENTAYRSRLVEIYVEIERQLRKLKEAQSAIKGKIISYYGDDIPSRTKHERVMWLEAGPIKMGVKKIDELEFAKFCVEQYILDIDKQSFDLTRMSNLLDLRTKREHVV